MLSVEGVWDELERLGVQPLAISCDNADSLHAWAATMGTLSFPVLADFWPHGEVSARYGMLNEFGVPIRASVVVDGDGTVVYVDTDHPDQVPPVEPMLDACRRCANAR